MAIPFEVINPNRESPYHAMGRRASCAGKPWGTPVTAEYLKERIAIEMEKSQIDKTDAPARTGETPGATTPERPVRLNMRGVTDLPAAPARTQSEGTGDFLETKGSE